MLLWILCAHVAFLFQTYTLSIQVCPLQSYFGDGMFRPSILLDREGSGFLGILNFHPTKRLCVPRYQNQGKLHILPSSKKQHVIKSEGYWRRNSNQSNNTPNNTFSCGGLVTSVQQLDFDDPSPPHPKLEGNGGDSSRDRTLSPNVGLVTVPTFGSFGSRFHHPKKGQQQNCQDNYLPLSFVFETFRIQYQWSWSTYPFPVFPFPKHSGQRVYLYLLTETT